MVFRELTGKYSELGVWWDTSGMSGPLEGSVLVSSEEFFAGHDPALGAIQALIKNPKN